MATVAHELLLPRLHPEFRVAVREFFEEYAFPFAVGGMPTIREPIASGMRPK